MEYFQAVREMQLKSWSKLLLNWGKCDTLLFGRELEKGANLREVINVTPNNFQETIFVKIK